jgi:predicted esterase
MTESTPPSEHTIAASTQGRYLISCPTGQGSHPLLVGFHGYGEQAETHLAELQRLPGAEHWLLASVQGLHWFYSSKQQRVVASWMTRLGREQAILDNIQYVDGVVRKLQQEFNVNNHLVYVGFSQGAAMAYRAAAKAGHACSGLIVLGGDLPNDLKEGGPLRLPKVLIGRGQEDDWYTQEKYTSDLVTLRERGIEVSTTVFKGGHEWTAAFRKEVGQFLTAVSS